MKYLIVGLGNIGEEYWGTRHNIGFRVVNALAEAHNARFEENRYGATCEFRVKNQILKLLKPNTYMNLSGNAVRYWMQEEGITIDHVLIICDDIALPFGTLRMKPKGSDGGHNGLKNIEAMLQTRDYARIRVGVGHEFEQGAQVDFVLGQFDDAQAREIPAIAERVISGLKTWSFIGIDKAMTQLNTKPKKAESSDNQNNKESE